MRTRDRMQNRIRALFTSDTSPIQAHTIPLRSTQPSSSSQTPLPSSPPCSATTRADLAAATASRSLVLERALAKTLDKLPHAEKAAFTCASKTIDERTLLSSVQQYDVSHKNDSSFRPHAERLSKFLDLLNRFMGGVAIGIQASPEISALVVGSVRIVIDLALKFTMYFSKLTDMICTFEDFLGPLAEYAKAADINLVETTVVNAYANMLHFSWKARRVFVDVNGNQRKCTSLRAFMRQHWETFESEFASIKGDLQHHLDLLLHSVNSLHFNFSRQVEQARKREEESKERSAFLAWLSNIDFEKTHQDTYAKKHEKTCEWLIREPKYHKWVDDRTSSLLWCHGKPGIGKSVLASNVIEDITARIGLREDALLCFAYYNYRNAHLKELHQVVTALLKQLCRSMDRIPLDLLQSKHDALSPSLLGTQERFVSLIEDLSEVYVVFDALDECPEQEREDIIHFITGIVTAQITCCVKVFVTSRSEMDIANAFEKKHIPTIQIHTANVTADIETFARSQVEKLHAGNHGKALYVNDDKLKEEIIQTLATRADGMFLWVNLQLDSLCQASKARKDEVVSAALEALPQGLPDTYIRILQRIETQSPYMRDLALNCLMWTVYAQRPLRTNELQHALAITSSSAVHNVQPDAPQVILEACGNLLEEVNHWIRPIHYTVQEFLTTAVGGLSQQDIRTQLLDTTSMHSRLSLLCLAYIQRTAFKTPVPDYWDLSKRMYKNQLASYAFQNFDYHVASCNEPPADVMHQLEILFQQNSLYLAAILQIKVVRDGDAYADVSQRFNAMNFPVSPATVVYSTNLYNVPVLRQRWIDQSSVPIYALHLAASAGLTSAVTRLLEEAYTIDEKDNSGSTPLYYACLNGNVDTVQIFFSKRAEVNAQGGRYGNSLQAASAGGHKQVVKMLLEARADVNAQGGYYGTALQAASAEGHEQVVKALLDEHADVNAQCGHYSNALQAASYEGHDHVVKILLDGGADIHAQCEEYGSALQAASLAGQEKVVEVLLGAHADVNMQCGVLGNALQAASAGGYEQVVKLLLDAHADVHAQCGNFGNALVAASYGGHQQTVKMLLDAHADVNAQGEDHYGTALQAAASDGSEQVVQMLLDAHANIHAPQCGYFGNALQAASFMGSEQIVRILLDAGADIKATGGQYGNALQAASAGGHEEVAKILLDAGNDVNIQGGQYGNALQAAACKGSKQIVEMLLNAGADINAIGGEYGSALQAASAGGHKQVVKILLDAGNDVNIQGGNYGTALQAAAFKGSKQVVQMLLDAGADVNAPGGQHGSALRAASARGHEQIVKILLDVHNGS